MSVTEPEQAVLGTTVFVLSGTLVLPPNARTDLAFQSFFSIAIDNVNQLAEYVVPANYFVVPLSVNMDVQSVAGGPDRYARGTLTDAATNQVWEMASPTAMAPNQVGQFSWLVDLSAPILGGGNSVSMPLPPIIAFPGYTYQFLIGNAQFGDRVNTATMTAVQIPTGPQVPDQPALVATPLVL